MKKTFAFLSLLLFVISSKGQNNGNIQYALKTDIAYIEASESDEYKKERGKLDIYYPENRQDFATIVWFHGGGLEGGEKRIPNKLKNKEYAIVAVNYRLSPKAMHPAYIEDAAQSVAWVFDNIQSFGGSSGKIYISGHSAGGYLALMVGLDKSYLAKYNIDADSIKGLIPISGQTNTHYTIRKERKLPDLIPVVDGYAPLNRARKGVPPTLLIIGDRRLEMTARYEENLHLAAILKALGNNVELLELQGFDHGNVYIPGCLLMVDWIRKSNR